MKFMPHVRTVVAAALVMILAIPALLASMGIIRGNGSWPVVKAVDDVPVKCISGQKIEITRNLHVPNEGRFFITNTEAACGCTTLMLNGVSLPSKGEPIQLHAGIVPITIQVDTQMKSGKTEFSYRLTLSDADGETSLLIDRIWIDVAPSVVVRPGAIVCRPDDRRSISIESATDLSQVKIRPSHPELIRVLSDKRTVYNEAKGVWQSSFEVEVLKSGQSDRLLSWVDISPQDPNVDRARVAISILPSSEMVLSTPSLWVSIEPETEFPILRTAYVQCTSSAEISASVEPANDNVGVNIERAGERTWRVQARMLNADCDDFNIEISQGEASVSLPVEITVVN